MEAPTWNGRYFLLVLDCLMGFGSYFNIDIPSALQSELQDSVNCTLGDANVSCCRECLNLGPDRYNQMYAVFLWMNSLTSLPGGFIIDVFGNRGSAIISCLVSLLGTVSFAVGVSPWFRHSDVMFPLMIAGRLLLGMGAAAVRIVQDRIIAHWFPDKLEMAFGIIVSVLRMGNVLNFYLTANIAQYFDIAIAAWTGVMICGVGFLSSILLCIFDRHGAKKISHEDIPQQKEKSSFNLKSLLSFPFSYWLVLIMIVLFYSAFFPFISNGCKLIQDKYGYDPRKASYINGINYDVPVLLGPIIGYILKRTGRRALVSTIGSSLLVTVFVLVAYTDVPAVCFALLMGVVYTLMAVSLWPSITKLVPLKHLGRANGLAAGIDGVFSGLASLAVGKIMGDIQPEDVGDAMGGWRKVLLILISIAVVCFVVGVVLNIVQAKSSIDNKNNHKVVMNIQSGERDPLLKHSAAIDDIY